MVDTINLTGTGTLAVDSTSPISYSPVLAILDPALYQAPTTLVITLEGAPPEIDITFEIDDIDATQTVVTTDSEGNIGPTSIPVLSAAAGTHTLTASTGSFSLDEDFTLQINPNITISNPGADADPVEIPEALTSTGVRRWVLQDLTPGGLGSYVFPANPTSCDPFPFRRTVSPDHTTAIAGAFHIAEPDKEVHPWSFKGTSGDQDFHDTLREYAELNRRLYLIDHRNRAWVIVITGTDFVPRRRTNYAGTLTDWIIDYTVRTDIHDNVWRVPQ